jgi:hypothetical protein
MRGGKREGAGRPKGALTKKTRLIAEQAMAEGITPLEVMVKAMRHALNEAYREDGTAIRILAPTMMRRQSAGRGAALRRGSPSGERWQSGAPNAADEPGDAAMMPRLRA